LHSRRGKSCSEDGIGVKYPIWKKGKAGVATQLGHLWARWKDGTHVKYSSGGRGIRIIIPGGRARGTASEGWYSYPLKQERILNGTFRQKKDEEWGMTQEEGVEQRRNRNVKGVQKTQIFVTAGKNTFPPAPESQGGLFEEEHHGIKRQTCKYYCTGGNTEEGGSVLMGIEKDHFGDKGGKSLYSIDD